MDKVAIYLRVSTKEQNEENQKEDCLKYCNNKGWEIIGIYQERVSAFNMNVSRPEQSKIIEKARLGEIHHVVVWAFDRWIRNRKTLIKDITTLSNYNCKLHSIKDDWVESINIDGPLGQTIREFMLGLVGSIAELESQRRSERISAGKHRSTKKQGRKITKWNIDTIAKLYNQKLTTRQIADEYNKLHRPNISHMTVSSIVKKL